MNRPYVHINCASTLDGRISRPDGSRLKISCEEDIQRVHLLRQELGSILVGAGTMIADDPKLIVKSSIVPEHQPLNKIVIDGKGRVPLGSRSFRTPGRSIIAVTEKADMDHISELEKASKEEVFDLEVLILEGDEGRLDLKDLLIKLKEIGVEAVLVEGGSSIIRQFVEKNLFDRFTIYYGPMLIGGRGPSIVDILEAGPIALSIKKVEPMGEGLLVDIRSDP